MKILSIQVGKPKKITHSGKEITTGIFKAPVTGSIYLRTLNLEGDGQADLTVHGGRDKALYAYSNDSYLWWRSKRPRDTFDFGAMGENLTVDTLDETKIFIGDVFEIGKATVQVTQPRFPCFKLAAKFNDPSILKQFMELNRPGVYFRVLKEGAISAGDSLIYQSGENAKVSVQELFNLKQNTLTKSRLNEILSIKSLNEGWRERLEDQLRSL